MLVNHWLFLQTWFLSEKKRKQNSFYSRRLFWWSDKKNLISIMRTLLQMSPFLNNLVYTKKNILNIISIERRRSWLDLGSPFFCVIFQDSCDTDVFQFYSRTIALSKLHYFLWMKQSLARSIRHSGQYLTEARLGNLLM